MNGYRIRCVICHKPYPKGVHTCPYCAPRIKRERKKYLCAYCGNEYKPEIKAQKYCSPKCYDADQAAIESENAQQKIEAEIHTILKKPKQEKQIVAKKAAKPEINCMDNLIKFFNPDYNCEMYKCEKMNIISMKKPCENCQYGDSNK